MKLHHFGIASLDINKTVEALKAILPVTTVSETIHDPEQDADICMVYAEGSLPIELISGDVVQSFVKRGILLYHTCWEVPDLDKAIDKMTALGYHTVSEPKKAALFEKRRVAFLSTPLGLIELLEAENSPEGNGT